MRTPYLVLDVFTTVRFKGNPLAVFPESAGISADVMQAIAAEMNLSETVFLLAPTVPGAIARARIFTPKRELDFAGHPTIGSACVIADRHATTGPFTIEENVGPVPIRSEKAPDGSRRFWLTTPRLTFSETVDVERCARQLGLPASDVADVSPQVVSAGAPLLFVYLNSVDAVDRAAMDLGCDDAPGSALPEEIFVFARKEPESATCFDVYARMFAPKLGIPEDPATGGATGPLAGYMLRYGILPRGNGVAFTSEQGTKMGRQSFLHVRIDAAQEPPRIEVGGSAVTVAEGMFSLGTRGLDEG